VRETCTFTVGRFGGLERLVLVASALNEALTLGAVITNTVLERARGTGVALAARTTVESVPGLTLGAGLEVGALAVGSSSGFLGLVLVSRAFQKSGALAVIKSCRFLRFEVSTSALAMSTANTVCSLAGLGLFVLSSAASGDGVAHTV